MTALEQYQMTETQARALAATCAYYQARRMANGAWGCWDCSSQAWVRRNQPRQWKQTSPTRRG